MQTGLAISKLAFVNDQACLKLPVDHFGDDLIEGNNFRDDIGCVQLQRKVCRGHRSRNGDLDLQQADKFVGMYVNERTLDYGKDGREAITKLLDIGYERGLIPHKPVVDFVGNTAVPA